MNKKTRITLLFLITLLAFILRFYRVTQIPPSLNWDEVSIGYNAYSIMKTGHDEWGKFLPLHLRSYGEYKLPVQIYASIPGIYFFGLNELGVRVTPVVYGTLTIILIYLLGTAFFNNFKIGLLAAFLLAISPWHIQLTRASFESSFATFWITLAIWLLVKGFKEPKYLIYSMVPFAISVYTYNTARIFTPLYLSSLFLIYFRGFLKQKRYLVGAFLVFLVLMIPLAPFMLGSEGRARYKLVSITDDPGLKPRINENRGNSRLIQPLPKIVHNKFTYVALYFVSNYFAHFTPQYLFISGAPHKQHHVQGIGELYWFQAPFLLLGVYLLFKKKMHFKWVMILWVILTYIPVALTQDSIPHALRNLIAAPAYQLLSAFGLVEGLILVKKRKIFKMSFQFLGLMIILILGVYQFIGYINNYFNIYPVLYSRDWQYGNKEVVNFIKTHQQNYDLIVFSRHYGEPHMFTLFYEQYDPDKFRNDPNLIRFETYDWVRVLKFDKYYFPDLGDDGTRFRDIVQQNPGKRILFVGKPGDFPTELKRIYAVNFLNGKTAFEVVEKL